MPAKRKSAGTGGAAAGSPFGRFPWLGPALFAVVVAAAIGGAWWFTQADDPNVPGVGEEAPDFALNEVESGEEVRLTELRGNPVVLVFYRTHG